MKNKLKKITAMLLSIGMLMTLCVGANVKAAEPETGSITIHKLKVEEEDDYNKLVEGLNNKGTGQLLEKDNPLIKDYKPFPGITFKLTKLVDDGSVKLDPKEATDLFNNHRDKTFGTDGTKEGTTDDNGEYKFDNLPLGAYLLQEEDHAQVSKKMAPAIIYVPTYNPENKTDTNAPKWLYDIHVYPKNLIHQGGPDIDKDVVNEGNNHAGENIGDVFPWIITTTVPLKDDEEIYNKYIITDVIDSRLDFVNEEKISIEMRDSYGNSHDYLTRDADYYTQYDESTRELKITLTNDGIRKICSVARNGKLVTKFYTKINDSAILGDEIDNTAHLSFTNFSGQDYEKDSDTPEVHTGGIKMIKVDKENSAKVLKGAEFQVFASEADAKAKKNPISINGKNTFESNEQGIVEIFGLAYGTLGESYEENNNRATDYWIVETKAPINEKGEPYSLLSEPLKVTVNATSHLDNQTITVYNALTNTDLPFTGGIGTIIFVIGGIALIGAAVVLNRKGSRKAVK